LVTKDQIQEFAASQGKPNPNFLTARNDIKRAGMYDLSLIGAVPVQKATPVQKIENENVVPLRQKKMVTEVDNLVPAKDKDYVQFGFYKQLYRIIASKRFYPVFITGLSGNGKTTMVEQACAAAKQECVRVNISIETDEDDLIGGQTLIDGNITYREGPVITAMRRGAVLLIDEIDRGSNKLMCMQAILEGKPFFNKKTGEIIHPAPGFNVIATANTKGQGTDDGKYIAAQILDEAFLERFPITVEQEYPTAKTEEKIILNKMETFGKVDAEFAGKLIAWSEIIRKTYAEGGVDEIISTRRLIHIVQAYSIFEDRQQAIQLCINRFDDDTKAAFLDLYNKLDAPAEVQAPIVTEEPVQEESI
ncbi:MAG: AAA family ATPase, partial [Candidatus Nanopelagicaceae bacterium]